MGYPVMMALAVACFAGLAAPVVGQDTNCVLSDLDEFEFMHTPIAGFHIYWTTPRSTISFRVDAEAEEWLAVGFSEDGNMIGSDAVVFLPDLDGEGDVGEHILGSQSKTDILPSDTNELSDTSFEQTGNDTIFYFTRNTTPQITDEDKIVIPNIVGTEIYLIWAKGMDNGFGFHGLDNRGAFLVDLHCPSIATTTPAPVTATVPTPGSTTDAPVAPTAGGGGGGSFTLPPMGSVADPVTPAPVVVASPTMEPAAAPTMKPAAAPTMKPTAAPTMKPAAAPTMKPSAAPAMAPVAAATEKPAAAATTAPVAPPSAVVADPTEAPAVAAATVAPAPVPTPSPVAAAPVAGGETHEGTPAPVSGGETHEGTPSPAGGASPVEPAATPAPAEEHGATTPAPVSRGIDGEETPTPATVVEGETAAPTGGATGFVAGAERVGGGVASAAVTSVLMAVSLGMLWARGLY